MIHDSLFFSIICVSLLEARKSSISIYMRDTTDILLKTTQTKSNSGLLEGKIIILSKLLSSTHQKDYPMHFAWTQCIISDIH